jgi:hypothetical protein
VIQEKPYEHSSDLRYESVSAPKKFPYAAGQAPVRVCSDFATASPKYRQKSKMQQRELIFSNGALNPLLSFKAESKVKNHTFQGSQISISTTST